MGREAKVMPINPQVNLDRQRRRDRGTTVQAVSEHAMHMLHRFGVIRGLTP
jgi:hypothetical protein